MSERERKLGENEALFRFVNEEIQALDERLRVRTASELQQFVCECSRNDCTEHIAMTLDEYREVHTDPTTFVMLHGHELPDVETVVGRTDRFFAVRKSTPDGAAGATHG